jgi:hypothetical protein
MMKRISSYIKFLSIQRINFYLCQDKYILVHIHRDLSKDFAAAGFRAELQLFGVFVPAPPVIY